jgi:hypothetical protein
VEPVTIAAGLAAAAVSGFVGYLIGGLHARDELADQIADLKCNLQSAELDLEDERRFAKGVKSDLARVRAERDQIASVKNLRGDRLYDIMRLADEIKQEVKEGLASRVLDAPKAASPKLYGSYIAKWASVKSGHPIGALEQAQIQSELANLKPGGVTDVVVPPVEVVANGD